ncbi:DUF3710 domain-containing protein [Arthrobacter roseus]|uniref:DUF3710 domain-containing protein n=1 Tax=Arthrobacter roseus TaxID=136274 RepID=UPI00196365E4|nr:DUF3710 domain-containing protein [Arthrobacter roseus]MBM7848385.1 hypothetical protein [Arthrobacter roseus]
MAFGRRKTRTNQDAVDNVAESSENHSEKASTGPFDEEAHPSAEGYVDLGAIRIAAREGLQLRLEVEESTKRVVAVTLDLNGSSLQLQAFAAPKSEGLWGEIREQISESVGTQGGGVDAVDGTFGTELVAKLPVQAPDGTAGYRVARFVGVDGPRWFLRGVFGGSAAVDREAAAGLEEVFRNIVVVRGDVPMPPRDLLPLRLPQDASGAAAAAQSPGLDEVKRGPEVTKIG